MVYDTEMVCPKCQAHNSVHNQHNERLVCIMCGYNVERPPMILAAIATDAFEKRLTEFENNK